MNTTPLTPDSVLAAPTHPEQAPDAYDWRNDPQLSEKWKKRFAFYDSLPPAGTSPFSSPPGMSEAWKKLTFMERILVQQNFLGFFFTFIYLIFLKLWKQAAMAFGFLLVVGVTGGMLGLSDNFLRAIGLTCGFLVSTRVNYWYFLKKAKGKDIGWMI